MKRFALVALVAALLFSMVTSASATELKVRGNIDVYGMASANLYDFDSEKGDGDNYATSQRMRAYFDYVASENLKAVLGLEIDNVWGEGTTADWGTDGKGNIEVKHAYLDFTFPDTQINVKAGLQYVALPSVFGNPVFEDDAAALVVSAPVTDMFALAAGYTRGIDGSTTFSGTDGDSDDKDMAFIAAPITLDGFSIAPYFAYAWIGEGVDDSSVADTANFNSTAGIVHALPVGTSTAVAGATDDSTVWVLGANAELTMFDPLTIAADLIYGQMENDDYETKGWYAALAASYKLDMLTATLFTTYFSGADEDGDEDNYLPTLAEGWGLTPYIGGVRAFSTSWDTFSGIDADMNLASWVVGLKLADIQFIDKLSHELTVAYAMGTSDEDAGVAFDEEDSAWEVYFVNKYMIYENLAAINELGFFAPDFDDAEEDNSYFATVGFQYKF